jgi:hypothetical protein
MVIQKKYYMIALLSISSISYGMDTYFADNGKYSQDPLEVYVTVRRHEEIRKTTRELNAAFKVASGSNDHYNLVEQRGPIRIVAPNMLKPKL